MKKFTVYLCFFLISFNLYSQSVYEYNLKKDIAISTLALGLGVGAYFMDNDPKILNNPDRNTVNAFDRPLMFSYNRTLHNIRDNMRNWIPVIPIITPLAGVIRKDFDTWVTYGFMYWQALALTYSTNTFIRKSVTRFRPEVYFNGRNNHPIKADSFPSDTTAVASFLPATFLSVTFCAEYPDSRLKIPVIAGSYALAASIGVMGVLSGMHYLSDVLVGAAIGSFYGWLIPTIHKRKDKDDSVSFFFTGNGVLFSLKF